MCHANRDGTSITAYNVFGFIVAVSVSTSSVLAQPLASVLSDDIQQAIDEYLAQFVEEQAMPGLSVGIVADDRMIYSRSLGVRSLESNEPVSDRTLFQICSITKAFTATLIALQVADGRLAWDDPIERYLPDWLEAFRFAQLSIHSHFIIEIPADCYFGWSANTAQKWQADKSSPPTVVCVEIVHRLRSWLWRQLPMTCALNGSYD